LTYDAMIWSESN